MKKIAYLSLTIAIALAVSGCGDKKDSAEKQAEAQKAIQEGMQKERSMMEGMQKGVESVEKKAAEEKDAAKK
ncbi:MAG: hypothetical protein ACREP3_01635 [Candidatus Binatia bacterium]